MYLSKSIESLVAEFSKLPGVGKKTAFRFALHLMANTADDNQRFANALVDLKQKVILCEQCHVPNDNKLCVICTNPMRLNHQICVVESYKDLIVIENTNQFFGSYHVLGGVISPIDGVGPDSLTISSLVDRVAKIENAELIMALNPTIEGDTTIYYITNQLKNSSVKITTISRGIAFGGELEYTDEHTLGRSILSRMPYQDFIKK
jgi:recombination protein RecR